MTKSLLTFSPSRNIWLRRNENQGLSFGLERILDGLELLIKRG